MWPRTRVVALQDFYNLHTATFFDRKYSGSNHGQRLGSPLPPHFGYPIAPNTIGEFHKFFRDLIVLLAGHHNRLVFSPFKVS